MAYTARKLITQAYYLSNIVSRGLQSVTGEQLSDGLDLLNSLLTEKDVLLSLIPYYQEGTFNTSIGKEKYTIPNLTDVELLTFNIGDVRYRTEKLSRKEYFAMNRVDSIQSLPYCWTFEREKAGGSIYLYFIPGDIYEIKYWGKLGFDQVEVNDDLQLLYDNFYINYLRYALAEYICSEYGFIFNPQTAKKLKELENILKYVSPQDLHITKFSSLTRRQGCNYGSINLGRGWSP